MAITLQRVNRSPFMFDSRWAVLGDSGSNGAISGWIKFKTAAGGHLEKLQMAISQRSVIQSTSSLVLGSVFRQGRMKLHYFGFAEIHDGSWKEMHFEKFKRLYL